VLGLAAGVVLLGNELQSWHLELKSNSFFLSMNFQNFWPK
jgi:hypothetical protein